jgi:hypothetical protein
MNWKIGWMGCLTLACMFSSKLLAQNVVIDAEFRPRTEVRDGYKSPNVEGSDAGVLTTQRTRVNFGYTSGLLNAQVTLQDARLFGQNSNSSSDATLGVYEAWAELVVLPGGTLKVGRQTLKYDDARLFSAPAWSLTGTSHDMALFKYQLNDWRLDVGYAYNNSDVDMGKESVYNVTKAKYRSMLLAWLSKEVLPGLTASAIFVDEGVQDTAGVVKTYNSIDQYHALTYGANLKYQTPDAKLNVQGATYFQSGKSVKGKDMEGSMLAFKADYKIIKKLSANAGVDWFSGDSKSSDNKQTNFKKLYGADHSFNGYMDYWNTPLDQGLLDYYAGASATITPTFGAEAGYHVFSTDRALASTGKKKLGSELDLVLNYKMNAQTSLQAGWCCYFKTYNALVAKKLTASEVKFPQWAYVMLTIKPTLFKN